MPVIPPPLSAAAAWLPLDLRQRQLAMRTHLGMTNLGTSFGTTCCTAVAPAGPLPSYAAYHPQAAGPAAGPAHQHARPPLSQPA